jgi:ABC-2 type transport system permease protein
MSMGIFFKKEWMEIVKTSKWIIMLALFIFFAILSPLSAKFMNEILAMVGEQQGVLIQFPDPTYIQSYEQFFKNIYFMMIIVTVLVFAGAVAEEKSRGTAILVLTKNLSRSDFILGKWLAAISLFTVSYVLSVLVCAGYTAMLFPEYINHGIIAGLSLYWIYGLMIITLTLLASVIFHSLTTAAVAAILSYAAISAIAALPIVGEYSPGALQTLSVELARGNQMFGEAIAPLLVTVGVSAAAMVAMLTLFNRQEL